MPEALKQSDLKLCAACERGLCHANDITFYQITLERHLVLGNAVKRQMHLEQYLGSPAIAAVMSPNEDMARRIGDAETFLLCERCALDPLVVTLERIFRRRDEVAESEVAL